MKPALCCAQHNAGFNGLYDRDPKTNQPRLIEVACWSHARRKLYDVHVATGAPLAKEALDRIAELFAIEDEINGRSPDERLTVRQAEAIPRIADLKTFFEAAINQISGKSTLARAIRYALSRWTALARYTTDGRLEISNNAAERAIRPLALGRKNYLFAGSDSGGMRAAAMYTIIETALCRARHKAVWTKPLRGSAAWQVSWPILRPILPAFRKKLNCEIMKVLLAAPSISQRRFP